MPLVVVTPPSCYVSGEFSASSGTLESYWLLKKRASLVAVSIERTISGAFRIRDCKLSELLLSWSFSYGMVSEVTVIIMVVLSFVLGVCLSAYDVA